MIPRDDMGLARRLRKPSDGVVNNQGIVIGTVCRNRHCCIQTINRLPINGPWSADAFQQIQKFNWVEECTCPKGKLYLSAPHF